MNALLVHMPYSPWSERARWALDHHRIPYRKVEWLPIFGEPVLRLALRRFSGKVTVPVLFQEGQTWADSTEIARRADQVGQGSTLFPTCCEGEMLAWNRDALAFQEAGRAFAVRRSLVSPAARLEALPRWIPPAVGAPVGRFGAGFLVQKYDLARREAEADLALMRGVLGRWRDALAGRPLLHDEISFADIAMAAALVFVRPPRRPWWRLGGASRDAWTTPELVRDFGDLLDWRDDTYVRHRRSD